jgi:hypothetical protein
MARIRRPNKAFPWVVLGSNVIEIPRPLADHDPESVIEDLHD